jgi:hypothetical protein
MDLVHLLGFFMAHLLVGYGVIVRRLPLAIPRKHAVAIGRGHGSFSKFGVAIRSSPALARRCFFTLLSRLGIGKVFECDACRSKIWGVSRGVSKVYNVSKSISGTTPTSHA